MEGCIAIEGVDRHVPRTPNGPPYGRVEERAQLPVVLLAGEPHRAYDLARARAALAIAQSLLRDPVFYLLRHIIKRNGSQKRNSQSVQTEFSVRNSQSVRTELRNSQSVQNSGPDNYVTEVLQILHTRSVSIRSVSSGWCVAPAPSSSRWQTSHRRRHRPSPEAAGKDGDIIPRW
jgi:hypothetical protein